MTTFIVRLVRIQAEVMLLLSIVETFVRRVFAVAVSALLPGSYGQSASVREK